MGSANDCVGKVEWNYCCGEDQYGVCYMKYYVKETAGQFSELFLERRMAWERGGKKTRWRRSVYCVNGGG